MQERELFSNYEIKSWNFTPRIYKILAFSIIVNLVALIGIAQTNLLTTKGCDSPLVGKICNVLDTLYVGGTVLATDAGYVEKPYDDTQLSPEDEVTFINVADKLYYPEGYFALANPEKFMTTNDSSVNPNSTQIAPGIPNPSNPTTGGDGMSLLDKPQELPPSNPNVVQGPLPKTPNYNPTVPSVPRPKIYKPKLPQNPTLSNESPTTLPNLDNKQIAEKKEEKKEEKKPESSSNNLTSEKVAEIEINKQPLRDLANEILANKDFDINKPFAVAMNGFITKDGKLDKKKSTYDVSKESGDEVMRNVAKSAIEKLGESGYFGYLRALGVEKISFTLVQDGEKISVVLTSDQPSEERAKTVASGLNSSISIGKMTAGEDEKKLLNGAVVTAKGKTFILNFVISKDVAQEMINRKLEEERKKREEEEKTSKPNSTAQIVERNRKTG
jgi:hypothetical protein